MLTEVEWDVESCEKRANLFLELCVATCKCNGTVFKILGVALLFLKTFHGGLSILENTFATTLLIGEMGVCGRAAAHIYANGGA